MPVSDKSLEAAIAAGAARPVAEPRADMVLGDLYGTDPDANAEQERLAASIGVPLVMLSDLPTERFYRRTQAQAEAAAALADKPAAQRVFGDPLNARIATDSVPSIGFFEGMTDLFDGALAPKDLSYLRDVAGDVDDMAAAFGRALGGDTNAGRSVRATTQTGLANAGVFATTIARAANEALHPILTPLDAMSDAATGVEPGTANRNRATAIGDMGRFARATVDPDFGYVPDPGSRWEDIWTERQPSESLEEFAVDRLDHLGRFIARSTVESAPTTVMAVLSMPLLLTSMTGDIGSDRAVADGRAEPTVGDLLRALPYSTASALLERWGARGLFGLDQAAVTTIKQGLKQFGTNVARETLVEFAQGPVEYLGRIAGTRLDTPDAVWGHLGEALNQGLQGALGSVGFSGGVSGTVITGQVAVAKLTERRRVADAQAATAGTATVLDALAANAANSPLRQRSPERFAEMADEVARGKPGSHLYVDAAEMMQLFQSQGVDPDAAATAMGIDPTQMRLAAAEGGTVPISVGNWSARVAGTPGEAALRDHVTLDPNKPTAAQARELEANLPALEAEIDAQAAAAETEAAAAEAAGPPAIDPGEALLAEQAATMRAELIAGGMSPDEADTDIALRVRAKRSNAELFGQDLLTHVTDVPLGETYGTTDGTPPKPAPRPRPRPTTRTAPDPTPAPRPNPTTPAGFESQEAARTTIGRMVPGVTVTSGFRDQATNARVGGAKNSYHTRGGGQALDLVPPPGMTMAQLHAKLKASGIRFTELLNEGDHVHIAWGGPARGAAGATPRTPPPAAIAAVINAGAVDGVSAGYLTNLARAESTFDPNAAPTTSTARGLYQFLDRTWLGIIKDHGTPEQQAVAATIRLGRGGRAIATTDAQRQLMALRLDPTASTQMVVALTRQNARGLQDVLGRQPTEGELYMAHFMGLPGARKLLKADESAVAATLFPKEAAANRGIYYDGDRARTVAEVKARLTRDFDGGAGTGTGAGAAPATLTDMAVPEMASIGDVAMNAAPDLDTNTTAAVDPVAAQAAIERTFEQAAAATDPDFGVAMPGQQASITPEQRTANFKAWFKESRATTPEGAPLMAFHGTTKNFDAFAAPGSAAVAARAEAGAKNSNWMGDLGSWFAAPSLQRGNYDEENAEYVAGSFTEKPVADRADFYDDAYADGANVMPVYLSVQNPVEFQDDENGTGYLELRAAVREAGGPKAFREAMMAKGHDGVVLRNSMTDGFVDRDDWVPFEPTQIKSIFNNGAYDPTDARILYQPGVVDEADREAYTLSRELAAEYIAEMGISSAPRAPDGVVALPDPRTASMMAREMEDAVHAPNDPKVKKSYASLIDGSLSQLDAMTDAGIVFEAWEGKGEPYSNSAAMMDDVALNGRLWYLPTETAFGESGLVADHPMLADSGRVDANGRPMLVNDVFRAIHDFFGHTQGRYTFGPIGELNAFLEHATMFPREAWPALAAETLLQNMWFNFGPHLRRKGDIQNPFPKPGDADYVPLKDRPFADQKAFAASEDVINAAFALQHTAILEARRDAERQAAAAYEATVLADYRSRYPDAPAVARLQDIRPQVSADGLITLTHYGMTGGLTSLDPAQWGANYKTLPRSERNRKGTAPDRTYYGLSVGEPWGYARESGVGPHRYQTTIPAEALYDVRADPDGLLKGDMVNNEGAIKAAGYKGWWVSHESLGLVAGVYEAMPVTYQGNEDITEVELYQSAPSIWYSALERAVADSATTRASAQQWIATISKTPGVKREEIEWTGLKEWLELHDGPVNRSDVMAYLGEHGVRLEEDVFGGDAPEISASELAERAEAMLDKWASVENIDAGDAAAEQAFRDYHRNGARDRAGQEYRNEWYQENKPKYGQDSWKLPGGTNYREIVLRLPGLGYKERHYGDDVLAWTRTQDFTLPDGRRVLHVDEVQSQLHQDAVQERKKAAKQGRTITGYREAPDPAVLEAAENEMAAAEQAYSAAARAYSDATVAWLKETIPQYEASRDELAAKNVSEPVRNAVSDQINWMKDMLGREPALRRNGSPAIITSWANGVWGNRQIGIVAGPPAPVRALATEAERASLKMVEVRGKLFDLRLGEGLPDAPFKSSWPALVMRRIIRMAVDEGYDVVTWATGDQQVKRYDLAAVTGDLKVSARTAPSTPGYNVELNHDAAMRISRAGHGELLNNYGRGRMTVAMTEDQLTEVFGNNVAENVMASVADIAPGEWGTVSGEGLEVGGKGMRAFYDRNLVNIANDQLKRHGVRVQPFDLRPEAARNRVAKGEARLAELGEGRPATEIKAEAAAIMAAEPNATTWEDAKPPAVFHPHLLELQRELANAQERDMVSAGLTQEREAAKERPDIQPGFEITPEVKAGVSGGITLFQSSKNMTPEERHKRLADAVPGIKGHLSVLTPKETEGMRASSVQQIVDLINTFPSEKEMAAVAFAGRAKRGWYERSAWAIVKVFGAADAQRFAALLAATSPQTSVEDNLTTALRTWVEWVKAGRPTDADSINLALTRGKAGAKGYDSVMPSYRNNTVTALSAENPSGIDLSGWKVNSFMLNLVDVVNEVTNDAWMGHFFGISGEWFTKFKWAYLAASAVTRRAAKILTKQTGYTWTPREVQETVWSFVKTLYEKGAASKETYSEILAAGGLTHEDIGGTVDFASLFTVGVYRNILLSGGYDAEVETLERGGGPVRSDGSRGSVTSAEGSGFADAAFLKFLDSIAKRLTALRTRRAEETKLKREAKKAEKAAAKAGLTLNQSAETEAAPAEAEADFAQDELGPGENRGSIKIPAGGLGGGRRTLISLFRARDRSTFLHETSHEFLEILRLAASRPNASDTVKRMAATTLQWLNVSSWDQIGVKEHERFADTGEQYFYDGIAPSLALRDVFAKFSSWLRHIYRRAKGKGIVLTPEIRDVFDRMIATEAEIKEARSSAGMSPLFPDAASAKAAGMTPETIAVYEKAAADAFEEARADATAQALAATRRATQAWWREEEKELEAQIAEDVDSRPVYRAFEWLAHNVWRVGEAPEGLTPEKLSRGDISRDYGESVLRSLPKGMQQVYAEDGVHPDLAAEVFGFASGGELLSALAAMEKRADVIEREVQETMIERHGDPAVDGTLPDVAMMASHAPSQERVMALEYKALSGRALHKGIKEAVTRAVGQRTVGDVSKPDRHLAAERKAANAAQEAWRKGDAKEAARQKYSQIVAFHTWRATRAAANEVEKAQKYVKRFDKASIRRGLPADYIEQIDALLEEFDFKKSSQRAIERREELSAFVQRMEEEGLAVNIDPRLLERARRRHYTTLTMDELRGLRDAIKSIETLGRLKKTLLDKGKRVDREALIAEFLAQTEQLKARKASDELNPEPSKLRGVDAELWKMETLADWLDEGDINGVMHRVLIRPAVEAANREGVLHEKFSLALKAHYDGVPKSVRKRWQARISPPELVNKETGQPFSMARVDLIAIALNMGNESNAHKLATGYGWDPADIMTVLERELTADEARFVQGVWDTLEGMWPDIAETERRLSGSVPERVVPTPLRIAGVDMAGGYYPVVYDRLRDARAERNEQKAAADMFNGIFSSAATPSGHTQKRTAYVGPLMLSVEGVLFGHVTKVIKRIAYAEFAMSAQSFIRDKQVRAQIIAKVGKPYYDQLMPWLQRQINDRIMPPNGLRWFERFAKTARTNTQMVAMGFRMSTGLAQIAGLASSAEVIGPHWLARGLVEAGQLQNDPQGFVFSRSEEMRQRAANLDRDLRDAMREMAGKDGVIPMIQRAAFQHIGFIDVNIVSLPTWLGAYYKALHEGLGEADAIASGDKAVRLSQGSGRAAHQSAAQSPDSEFMKLFTMFYSYFNVMYQRQRLAGRAVAVGDFGKALNIAFWWMLVSPLAGAFLTGDGPGDDDEDGDKDWLAWGAAKVGFGMFSSIPLLRDVASVTERKVRGKYAEYSATPVSRGVQASEAFINEVVKFSQGEELGDRALKTAIETPGYFTGLPTGQLANTTQYLWDVMEGDQQPENAWQFLYGFAKGPQEDQE